MALNKQALKAQAECLRAKGYEETARGRRTRRATESEQGGPWTLHQLRHSAPAHDAENGASTPMLMAKSGHTSVASLARYARLSAEALARWQESHDPARRR